MPKVKTFHPEILDEKERKKLFVERYQANNMAKGLCRCGQARAVAGKTKCQACLDRTNKWYKDNKERCAAHGREVYAEVRALVMDHYGAECVCCHESYPPFLCLDHINGGGRKHQDEVGGRGNNYYKWIIANNYPEGLFQILCANCNQAKGIKGRCPCKEVRETRDFVPIAIATPK